MNNKEVKTKRTVKKKKFTLKKVKKLFVSAIKGIGKKISKLRDKFRALPNTAKYIIYVWSAIFVLVIFLILISSNNNKFLKDYKNLEKTMNAGVLDYVETNSLYPVKDNKLKVDLEFMLEENYVYAKELTDKSCSGFSLVYYDDVSEKYVTNSYINCSKYTTDGYSDYK